MKIEIGKAFELITALMTAVRAVILVEFDVLDEVVQLRETLAASLDNAPVDLCFKIINRLDPGNCNWMRIHQQQQMLYEKG